MNLLDSHDVPRALHTLSGDAAALKLALLMLFLHPGAPCIYYGSEAGLAGGPDGDHATGPSPGCREAFPWHRSWDVNLSPWIAELTQLRRRYPALRRRAAEWTAIGVDGLSADFGDLQVLVNRSRETEMALNPDVPLLWTSQGTGDQQNLKPQSACFQQRR